MNLALRPVLVLAAAASLAVAGTAAGAPKSACNLVTDPATDGLVDKGALEIVSADIATTKRQLTTVIRVAKAATSSSTAPTGMKWQMSFTVGDANLFTSVLSDPVNGVTANYGYFDPTSGSGSIEGTTTPVIDTAKNEIRVTVSPGAFSTASIRPGTEISKLGASAVSVLQAPTGVANLRVFNNDTASSSNTYKAGSASCVKHGA